MSNTSIEQYVTESVNGLKNLKEQMINQASEHLSTLAGKILASIPKHKDMSVGFEMSTPYFNDGEPCVNSINNTWVGILDRESIGSGDTIYGEDINGYAEQDREFFVTDENIPVYDDQEMRRIRKAHKIWNDALHAITSDMLEDVLGTNIRIAFYLNQDTQEVEYVRESFEPEY